jgi:hypothetical protein
VTPPLSESDITRERLALEESIRKVEAESARQFVEAARQSLPPRLRSAEFRQRDELPKTRAAEVRRPEPRPPEARQWRRDAEPPRSVVAPPPPPPPENQPAPETARAGEWPPTSSPPMVPDEARRPEEAFEQLPEVEAPAPSPPPPPRRAAGERRSFFDIIRREPRDAEPRSVEADGTTARADIPGREPHPVPPPAAEFDRSPPSPQRLPLGRSVPQAFEREAPHDPTFDRTPHEPRPHEQFSEPMHRSSFPADDEHLTVAPGGRAPPPPADEEMEYEPAEEEVRPRPSYRDLTRGAAIAGLLIVFGGFFLWQWPNMVGLYRSFRTPAVETTRETPPPSAARPKITDRIEPGSQQAPAAPVAPGAQPPVAAAQKVVLYEEDPAEPNGKRFVGSAIWRTEMVAPAPGQPPELAVRADIEVPERKLAVTWSLRRNTDKGLPATHTVEITFKLPADFPSGGISNVPGILMKQAEQTRGVPLAGLAVKVTPGFYLIGLSNLEADKDRNIQLLKERGWFDIPVVYNNNRRAILAMEKGSPGERVFADAFKAWKQ